MPNGATSGAVPVDSTGYSSGDTVKVKGNTGNLAKTNSVFLGWDENPAATTTTPQFAANQTFTITKDTTLYAIWLTKTDFGIFTRGETGTRTSTITAPKAEFVRLELNGTVIPASNYTVTEGSTIIELTNAYLNSLASGTYYYTAVFQGASANNIKLVVDVSRASGSNPYTGDDFSPDSLVSLAISTLTITLLSGYWLILQRKKRLAAK
jgi:hypothetical protein